MTNHYDVESDDLAYLQLSKEDIKGMKNPFHDLSQQKIDNLHLYALSLMRNPKYFYWTVKTLLGIELLPEQVVVLRELWTKAFPMYIASRGFGKSFLLAVYCMLRCALIPGTKIVIVGSAFRQSKVIFEYMDTIWRNAPLLQSICSDSSGPRRDIDRCLMKINESWAMAVPLGDGTKIRGLRAHTIIADEFNCARRDTLVETDSGLWRIQDLMGKDDFRVVNFNGMYEKPANNIITPKTDVYEIITEYGYSFGCSKNHIVKTQNGWKKALELTKDDYILSDNKYIFPNKSPDGISKDLAWIIGVLISEGTLTNKNYIGITTTDEDFANRCIDTLNRLNKNPKLYTVDSYKDDRGWECKKKYEVRVNSVEFRKELLELGLEYSTVHDKKIPWSILQSNKTDVVSFLSGLFEGDGSCFTFKYKNHNNRLACAYYTVSETLAQDLQTLLLKFDLICQRQTRSSKLSKNIQWMLRLNGEHALDLVNLLSIKKWNDISENAHVYIKPKTYGTVYLKDKDKYKACISSIYGQRNKYIGTYKTQAEAIEAVDKFLKENPRGFRVKKIQKLDIQEELYDFYLPETHSFYGNGMVQHNSIPVEIYETVVAGFAAVSAKPTDNVKKAAKRKKMQAEGRWTDQQEDDYRDRQQNQSILSGTCGYDFEPFADYWKKYKSTIINRGDFSKMSEDIDSEEVPDYMKRLDWKQFSVIRIPYELIPEGFMDDQQVTRARATMHNGIYQMEYGAVFTSDSQGFFKRSLIEAATAHEKNINKAGWPSYCPQPFDVITRGQPGKSYVFGIDPASEQDNFALIVLELHNEHQRIVYSWTTNKKDFQARVRMGLTDISDYYSFCVRKVRELMRVFPCVRIGIDSQGGGYQIAEGLADEDKLQPGERKILPIIEDKEKPTDDIAGDHILEFINFAKAEWTSQANHGLRKDIEDKVLLFPRFDTLTLSLMTEKDKMQFNSLKEKYGDSNALKLYDTLEDCVMDVEELKSELTTVVVSVTANGRERFDTPEIKLDTGKKGRMRKDRYSALVIANMIARSIQRAIPAPTYINVGRVIGHGSASKEKLDNRMYVGAEWADSYNPATCFMVNKNR